MKEQEEYNWREDFKLVRLPDYQKYLSQSEYDRKKNLVADAMEIYMIVDESGKKFTAETRPYNWFLLKLGIDFMAKHDELIDSPEDQEYLTRLYKQITYILFNSRSKYRVPYWNDRSRKTGRKIKVKKTIQ